jgi:hypothetical protein
MTPACPPNYECTFTPSAPHHVYDPWWTGPWGPWVTLAAIVALAVVLVWLIVAMTDTVQTRGNRRREAERERETRDHELALAEQLTMQLDSAHGDPEVLKLIRTMQRRAS